MTNNETIEDRLQAVERLLSLAGAEIVRLNHAIIEQKVELDFQAEQISEVMQALEEDTQRDVVFVTGLSPDPTGVGQVNLFKFKHHLNG